MASTDEVCFLSALCILGTHRQVVMHMFQSKSCKPACVNRSTGLTHGLAESMLDAAFLSADNDDSGQLSAAEIDNVFFSDSLREGSSSGDGSKKQLTKLDWIGKDLHERVVCMCSDFVPALSLEVWIAF